MFFFLFWKGGKSLDGELAESQFRTCYPDKKQKCDVESADSLPWDTTIRFFLFT
ncbi:hypothetical protein NPIL_260791, partial [Nephila pilipes]